MEDNSTTNNENNTYAPENVYPIDTLQSPIQQAEVEKNLETYLIPTTVVFQNLLNFTSKNIRRLNQCKVNKG